MIYLGIDALDIERCTRWSSYSIHKLQRLFSQQEIDYCLENRLKSAERFAVRFAAKEALFKALAGKVPLLRLYKSCEVIRTPQPAMRVNWAALKLEPLTIKLSLTHTKTTAIAVVLVI